jgi:hypothetical protein
MNGERELKKKISTRVTVSPFIAKGMPQCLINPLVM